MKTERWYRLSSLRGYDSYSCSLPCVTCDDATSCRHRGFSLYGPSHGTDEGPAGRQYGAANVFPTPFYGQIVLSSLLLSTNERTENVQTMPLYPVVPCFSASPTLCKNRPLILDLQDMLCADALAVSKSTLHFLSLAHTRAQTFFVPDGCDYGEVPHQGRFYVQSIRKIAMMLLKERPHAEVCREACFVGYFYAETDGCTKILR